MGDLFGCSIDKLDNLSPTTEIIPCYSRKDKSLYLLAQRFLELYPVYFPKETVITVCIDAVATLLNVERRRIYDIVNILEALDYMKKISKNTYQWYGKANMGLVAEKLKKSAIEQDVEAKFGLIKQYELELKDWNIFPSAEIIKFNSLIEKEQVKSPIILSEGEKRPEKSLSTMCQKIMMIFLVEEPKPINLETVAHLLNVTAPLMSRNFKTKVRRLYDVTNVLSSLEFIDKSYTFNILGRRSAFRYIGPRCTEANPMKLLAEVSISNHEHEQKKLYRMLNWMD